MTRTTNTTTVIAAVTLGCLSLLATACTDKAEAGFKECEKLEAQGKLEEAILACRAAHHADARSPYGEKALALESKLLDKTTELEQRRKAAEAESKESNKVSNAEAKVHWVRVSTPPNDPMGYSERCMARNRNYENSYNCEPQDPSSAPAGDPFPFKEECLLLAEQRGCVPFHADSPTKLFCCTK
jgi:hypothetical protein